MYLVLPMYVVYDKANAVIVTQQGQLLMVHGSGTHYIGTPPTRITTKLFLLLQQQWSEFMTTRTTILYYI